MSIFDSLFGHKKEEQKEDKVNLTKQIDTLVLVIENLGLLNKEKIIEKLDKLPVEYDKNLIKRLSISEDKEKLSALYKYLEKDNLSFGKESINSLRKQLEFISSNNSLTQDNMIEEMLNVTEKYINKYKSIIEELNNSIKTFEMAKPTYYYLAGKQTFLTISNGKQLRVTSHFAYCHKLILRVFGKLQVLLEWPKCGLFYPHPNEHKACHPS